MSANDPGAHTTAEGTAGAVGGHGARLRLVHFTLALINILAVVVSFALIDQIGRAYGEAVADNAIWAARVGQISELRRLVRDANAPGNDVFQTGPEGADVARERLVGAVADFERAFAAAEAGIRAIEDPGLAAALADELVQVGANFDRMRGQADVVFDRVTAGRIEEAAAAMAAMDRAAADADGVLASIGDGVRAVQSELLAQQDASAARSRRLEFTVAAVLILLMAAAMTAYGTLLTRTMRRQERARFRQLRTLDESETRQRVILASTLDPVVTIDGRGRVLSVSDSVERVFGWKPAELIGRNISVLMPEPHAARHDEYLRRYGETGVSNILGRARELEGRHRDGHAVPLEVSVSRVDPPGGAEPIFTGIIHDITERRAAEAELARYREHLETLVQDRTRALEESHDRLRMTDRLAAIGTLAAGLGHDMNNVLFPVRCRLDALAAGDLSAEAMKEIVSLREMLRYLQQLSDGLRLLALDPDDPEAAEGETDLGAWWDGVRPLLLTALPSGAVLEGDISCALPPVAMATHRFTQAIFNLVVNAGEAVGEQGIVRVWARAGSQGVLRVGVTDNGRGMSEDVRDQALNPFFTTKKRGLSTGLGLAIVHQAVTAVDGRVEIESAPGAGTTISLVLPALADVDAGASGGPNAVVGLADARIASFVGSLLRTAGYDVGFQSASEDPPEATLWVTEPVAAALEPARQFLNGYGRRRLILVGEPDEAWADVDGTVVHPSEVFEGFRDVILSVDEAYARGET